MTATQQSATASEGLDDNQLNILREEMNLPERDLKSGEDFSHYLGLEDQVDRVRPYVSVAGSGESRELQFTEFAKQEMEACEQRELKRARRFVHHPTIPLLHRLDVDFKQLNIDSGTSHEPSAGCGSSASGRNRIEPRNGS